MTTNDSGEFNTSLTVPASWTAGIYYLSVNGEPAPDKYYVLASPAIRPLVDTLPITLRAGDSLWVKGIGFQPGEIVNFYLDSIALGESAIANSNNEFVTLLRMPYIAEHSYLLVARGARSGNATADLRVTITRTADYEFEDMMPPDTVTPGDCDAENVSYFWEASWSKQMFVVFRPDTVLTGAELELSFTTPRSDTFNMIYHASIGPDQGRYAIRLDGDSIARIDGYGNTGGWMPNPLPTGPIDLGIHFLPAGRHNILFTCLGKADSATAYNIFPDCLVLKPTTYMPPTPGTILAGVTPPDTALSRPQNFSLQLYPNPVRNGAATIDLTLPATHAEFYQASVAVQVFDVLGREIPGVMAGYVANGILDGTLEFPNALPGTYYVKIRLTAPSGALLDLPPQNVIVE